LPLPTRSWPPSRWSLTRKLPLLTAAIVVLVVATSLTATYRALVDARTEALHERLSRVARQLAASSEQANHARALALRAIARDSGIVALVRAGQPVPAPDTASPAMRALARVRLPIDSQMPVELWSADGQRLVHLGVEVPGDPLRDRRPELLGGGAVAQPGAPIPSGSDSIQLGALYPAAGRVHYWTIVPVFDGGRRIGYIAQQRRIGNSPQQVATVRELIGSNVTVYVRNITDDFWATLTGQPIPPPIRRDSTPDGFETIRANGRNIGFEARIAGSPWVLEFEAPASTTVTEPRATVRRLLVFSLLITVAGVLLSWVVSRRITRPLTELATAAGALAAGDYQRRVKRSRPEGDEIHRLGASFNRMATEVQTAQQALAARVEEAHGVSEALHRATLEAVEARDAAEQANQAKSDFLAVMSHELRTPLNAIGGYAEILTLGIYGPVTDQQRDAIQRIARSQQTLLSLINDVLNFAKLEAGEVQYQMQDVALASVVEALDALVAPQLADRELRYSVDLCHDSLVVLADPDKLQQVLLNLLSNAIKFTPVGGEIAVRCGTRGDRATISVQDSGIGIAPERMQAIFDPFIQVGRALNRPHDGVGLGLSISRDLAEGMGGSLTVTSEVGVGSTFTLELARAR
jgi:signal transduction histidine kinase